MSKREGQDYAEYMRVTADERNRIVRLRDLKLDLPAVNVFDSPVRCFKVNHEWWKIIHGAVSLLLELDAWQNAENESYSGIQQILEFLEGMDCFDCDDVENCLDTSPTITTIQGDIINVTNTTIQNSTDIDTLENTVTDTAQTDGNVYPSYPIEATEPDAACGAAFYVIAKVREFIVDLESATGTYATLQEAIEAYLVNVINLIFSPFYVLLAAIFSGSPPLSVLTDLDNQASDMREYLYCNSFDKTLFEVYVRTLTNGDAIADFIACIGLGTWNQWVAIGSTDETQDCSSFNCSPGWSNELDFSIESYAADLTANLGTYWDGSAWHSDSSSTDALFELIVTMPVGTNLEGFTVFYECTPSVGGYISRVGIFNKPNTLIQNYPFTTPVSQVVGGAAWNDVIMKIQIQDADQNKVFRVTRILLNGTGNNPGFGVDV